MKALPWTSWTKSIPGNCRLRIKWGWGCVEGLSSRFDVTWELKHKEAVNEGFYLFFYPWAVLVEMELDYGVCIPSPAPWTRAKLLQTAARAGAERAVFPR